MHWRIFRYARRNRLLRQCNAALAVLVFATVTPRAATSQTFDALFDELRAGPVYFPQVETGIVLNTRFGVDSIEFPYFLQVPATYTPGRRYPVRVFLHGGVSRGPWSSDQSGWWRAPERVTSEEYIGVFPAAWNGQRWWQSSQLENLRGILRELRQTYNTDENRVSLIGVSDGGTGAYFVAFNDTTPWAAYLPFIAHPAVLLNPGSGATGEIFRTNLTNKPLFVVNGDEDRLYPTRAVDPYIAEFSAGGVELVYRPLEGYGHETTWWPDEAGRIDEFISARPREPHPTCVSWETEVATGAGARAHWLRLDTFGATALDASFAPSPLLDGGVPSGRVDAQRVGNEIRLRSSGVRGVTLLISPDVFDVTAHIKVWWNGVQVHDATIMRSVDVLSRWAERDHDRTMLYAAEVSLEAPIAGAPALEQLPAAPGSAECRGV